MNGSDEARMLNKGEMIEALFEDFEMSCEFLEPFDLGFAIFSALEGEAGELPYSTIISKDTEEEIIIMEFHSMISNTSLNLNDLLNKGYISNEGVKLIQAVREIGYKFTDPYEAIKKALELFDKKYKIFPTTTQEGIEYCISMGECYYPSYEDKIDISGQLAEMWEEKYISKFKKAR